MKKSVFFEWKVINFCIKWQFVVNEREIVQHSLKMLYISLLPKYPKHLDICKNPLCFTCVLVLGFKFVYVCCTWSFTVISLYVNPQSTFFTHKAPSHSRHFTCTVHITHVAEHMWHRCSLDGPGQNLLKLLSVLWYSRSGWWSPYGSL